MNWTSNSVTNTAISSVLLGIETNWTSNNTANTTVSSVLLGIETNWTSNNTANTAISSVLLATETTSTFLNAGVLFILISDTYLRRDPYCVLVLSLSFSDFMVAISSSSYFVSTFLEPRTLDICATSIWFMVVFFNVSQAQVAFICIARIIAVKFPVVFKQRFGIRLSIAVCLITCCVTMAVYSVPPSLWLTKTWLPETVCTVAEIYRPYENFLLFFSYSSLIIYAVILFAFIYLLKILQSRMPKNTTKNKERWGSRIASVSNVEGTLETRIGPATSSTFDQRSHGIGLPPVEITTFDTNPAQHPHPFPGNPTCISFPIPTSPKKAETSHSTENYQHCLDDNYEPCLLGIPKEPKRTTNNPVATGTFGSGEANGPIVRWSKHALIRRSQDDSVRTLSLIILLLTFLIVPTMVTYVCEGTLSHFDLPNTARRILFVLTSLTSFSNPLIYAFSMQKFKAAVRRKFCGLIPVRGIFPVNRTQ